MPYKRSAATIKKPIVDIMILINAM